MFRRVYFCYYFCTIYNTPKVFYERKQFVIKSMIPLPSSSSFAPLTAESQITNPSYFDRNGFPINNIIYTLLVHDIRYATVILL